MIGGRRENKKQTILFRDSIHNYIEIPERIANKIIDTPVFQRLQQIE